MAADSPCVVSFVPMHQILTIPQAELLARSHQIRGVKRQNKITGERVISGKLIPLSPTMCEKLTQWKNDVIAGCCYDNINMIF